MKYLIFNKIKIIFSILLLTLTTISMNATDKIAQAPTEKINVKPVVFKNKFSNFSLVGTIFTPKNMKSTEKLPAILLQGPMGSVKEQTASLYAQILAEKGFVTMVYDYSYFGGSEGLPRGYEDPEVKANDIESAVNFLSEQPNVDKSKIYAVGICGSGVYIPFSVVRMKNNPLKAIAVINPFEIIHSVKTKSEEELLKDKQLYEEKGIATRLNMIEEGSEGAEYYYNNLRGSIPRNHWIPFVTWSELSWRKFFPAEEVKKLNTPFLVIAGENAFTRQGAELMHQNAKTNKKELLIVSKSRHFDLYDKEEYVNQAIAKILEFFKKNA